MEIPTLNKMKKGQSLVEVMVSMTILILVIITIVSLILSIMNLNYRSRNKTEVLASIQSEITNAIVCLEGGGSCNVTKTVGIATITITVGALDASEVSNTYSLNDTNFQKIRAVATWRNKGDNSDSDITIDQIVRK